MSQSDEPPLDLGRLRDEIDLIDSDILALLKRRMDVVTAVAAFKKGSGKLIRDHGREAALLEARREKAQALGLASQSVESIFRQIMTSSRDYQASLGAERKRSSVEKSVAIIGGCGAMGRRMQGLFSEMGHRVLVVDVDTQLQAAPAAAEADVVVVAVPIDETLKVIAEVGPHVRPDALMMDITSLKAEFVAAMLKSTQASVLGSHPMFGPGVHSLLGQRVALCRGRGDDWYRWAADTFEGRGLVVAEATPEQHDRAMGLVQVLNHFQTQVFGMVLARSGVPLEDSLQFTSPAYLMELYVVARHFGQSPDLYGAIEMGNPAAKHWTAAFGAAVQELADVIARKDHTRFSEIFAEVRGFFGDFTAEATEQSQFLIDRLIERSI